MFFTVRFAQTVQSLQLLFQRWAIPTDVYFHDISLRPCKQLCQPNKPVLLSRWVCSVYLEVASMLTWRSVRVLADTSFTLYEAPYFIFWKNILLQNEWLLTTWNWVSKLIASCSFEVYAFWLTGHIHFGYWWTSSNQTVCFWKLSKS